MLPSAAHKQLQTLLSSARDTVARLWGMPRSTAPARSQVGGPLDGINDQFHEAHAASGSAARREVPVFVVLGDQLISFVRDQRRVWSFAPREFHVIKSVTHAPLTIYASFEQQAGAALEGAVRARLESQQKRLAAALQQLAADAGELSVRTRDDLRTVLQSCADLLDAWLAGDHEPRAALEGFARELGPVLPRLADDATQLQLDALHAHVEEARQLLHKGELAKLQVVVAGDHQARARSLAMQYFQKRLREPQEVERRVTYAEGVCDEEGALSLVGTRRLDHALGRAFFGNEDRLQRDILGDAAHARLASFPLDPLW